VRLLLVGHVALVAADVGIVAASQRIGFAGLGLQLALELVGLSLLACLILL
jgi:hypothetical protein